MKKNMLSFMRRFKAAALAAALALAMVPMPSVQAVEQELGVSQDSQDVEPVTEVIKDWEGQPEADDNLISGQPVFGELEDLEEQAEDTEDMEIQPGSSEDLEVEAGIEESEWEFTRSTTGIYINKYLGDSSIVEIPDRLSFGQVSGISASAFSDCRETITKVVFPNMVTELGAGIFKDCKYLKEVVLPENLRIIGKGAFENCQSLTNIIIPESVNSIGENAFYGCDNPGFTSVRIPDWVRSIGEYSFYCKGLKTIYIGKSLFDPPATAFMGPNVQEFVIEPVDSILSANNGILYQGDKLVCYPRGRATAEIPVGTKEIGLGAFRESNYANIIIPDTVTTIASQAFMDCSNLSSLKIPSSVTEIGDGAFWHCDKLILDCSENSYAAEYAKKNKISYKTSDNVVQNYLNDKNTTVSLDMDSYTWDGTAKMPDAIVQYLNNILTKGTDYTIEYRNNVNIGTGRVVITGKGNYKGTIEKNFYIVEKSLLSPDINISIAPVEWDGTAKTPAVTIKSGKRTLIEETDYTIQYFNNINRGTGMAYITGIGNFKGNLSVGFPITERNIAAATLILDAESYTWDNMIKAPGVTVKDGSRSLVMGTDYIVTYTNNVNVGTATVTVEGMGNYTGTIMRNFTINRKDISSAEVILHNTSYIYDGKSKTPDVTVKVADITLTKNTDYTVSYNNNVNAGQASVIITGVGNYTGTVIKSFTIKDEDKKSDPNQGKTMSLNKKKATVLKGKKITLKVTGGMAKEKITWSSSRKKVATVDKDGKVKAKAAGTATITAKAPNGQKAVCKVTVPGIKLKKKAATLKVNGSTTIKIKSKVIKKDKVASYKVSNKKIISVNKKGKVKALKPGQATVTIKMKSGAKATFKVTVRK